MSNEDTARPGPAIGVFGGTFDPVHIGHLRIALDAVEALGLDHVRLVPLATAVHREQPATPAALRQEMLEAAVRGRSDLVVDDCELRRDGPSYTVDTLRSLRQHWADRPLCLLLGADAFAGFGDWREPDTILQLANLVVMVRPGHDPARMPAVGGLLRQRAVAKLDFAATGQVLVWPVTQLDIASSDIRRRVAAGRSIDFLVPEAVARIIAREGLYR